MAITAAARTEIITLVTGMFDAAPGATYLNEFVNVIDNGGTIASLANSLAATSAFKGIYPDLLTTNEFATKFINNLVGSEASDANKAWAVSWVEAKLNGGASRAEVMVETITALDAIPATHADWGNAAAALDNQVDVATWYSVDQLGNATDLATLQGVTSSVTSDAATVTAAKSGTAQSGSTFTLTTAADTLSGTAGNDAFNGYINTTTATVGQTTLTGADTLDGGAGDDTLSLTVEGANAAGSLPGAPITNIENFNIRDVNTSGTSNYNFGIVTGEKQVTVDRSSAAVDLENLATGTEVIVAGDGSTTLADVRFEMATGTDAVNLTLSGGINGLSTGTDTDVTVGGATAVNSAATAATIKSIGGANKVDDIDLSEGTTIKSLTIDASSDLTADLVAANYAADAAITVTGAATKVDIDGNQLAANVKTVDASGMTAGGVHVALNTGVTSFKGGQGSDRVATAALGATATVAAGEGTDTLVVAAATDLDTAAEAAKYTGFETLSVSNAQDMSLLSGITAVEVTDGGNALTKMDATQAAAVTQTATGANNSYALATDTGTADVLTLNLSSTTATTNVSATGLTIDGFETLNINATTGTAGTDSDVTLTSADKLTTVKVTGSADYTFSAANSAKALTVDAGDATGAATISGNFVNGSSVTTGTGKDAITLGTGFGTYNSGAGNDTFNGTLAQLNTGANYNQLDGGEGTDTLNITGGAALTVVDNNLSKISNIEKIVVATTGTNDQSITTGGFFDAAFKTDGVDLTTTASTGNITIDMTSFTGNATLSATTVGTAGGQGALDIQTGTGADTITVSAAAAGDAGTVKTYAGDDKITTTGNEAITVTAGAGNDTLVFGGTGVNTAVFENTAALNGADTITGFAKATDIINWVQGGAETAITGNLTTTANVFYQLGGLAAGKADTAADVAAAITAGATWTAAAATAWVAVSDDNSTSIYEWKDAAGTAGAQEGELTLVGTVDAAMSTAELATAITIV